MKTFKYTIHRKRLFSDGIGEILGVSNSIQKSLRFVRENYTDFKRDSSQDCGTNGFITEWYFGNEDTQEGIWVEIYENIVEIA